jgi:dUTP pyrophosphatase
MENLAMECNDEIVEKLALEYNEDDIVELGISDYDEFFQELQNSTSHFEEIIEEGEVFDDKPLTTDSVQFVLNSSKAKQPALASTRAAGFNIFSSEEKVILPGKIGIISTGVHLLFPTNADGMYGEVKQRTEDGMLGLIIVGKSIVDSDKEIVVALQNLNDTPFKVYQGSNIAQVIIQKSCHPTLSKMPLEKYLESRKGAAL